MVIKQLDGLIHASLEGLFKVGWDSDRLLEKLSKSYTNVLIIVYKI